MTFCERPQHAIDVVHVHTTKLLYIIRQENQLFIDGCIMGGLCEEGFGGIAMGVENQSEGWGSGEPE